MNYNNFCIPSTMGHTAQNRKFCLYSVWNNKTDEAVLIDGTAEQCAAAMGIKPSSFWSIFVKTQKGQLSKWTIKRRYVDGKKQFSKWVSYDEQ